MSITFASAGWPICPPPRARKIPNTLPGVAQGDHYWVIMLAGEVDSWTHEEKRRKLAQNLVLAQRIMLMDSCDSVIVCYFGLEMETADTEINRRGFRTHHWTTRAEGSLKLSALRTKPAIGHGWKPLTTGSIDRELRGSKPDRFKNVFHNFKDRYLNCR